MSIRRVIGMDKRVSAITARVAAGEPPTWEDCVYLLGFHESSPEATLTRGAANDAIRGKTGNTAALFGQIGLELYPCEADCKFCAFGKSHTSFTGKVTLGDDAIRQKVLDFTQDGDLYCLWLMTMDQYDLDYYLHAVRIARETAPPQTLLFTNIGDTGYEAFAKMKEAGIDGAYHILRLGEGVLTSIAPETRLETIRSARAAGLMIQDCLEPIGPEHTPEELADHIFRTVSASFNLAGVMKRTAVPGTGFRGEISNLRQAQIVAVNAMALIAADPLPWTLVHEAEYISLASGANSISAETGVNPRDVVADTSQGRGLDVSACRKMLWQAGFSQLALGDGARVALTPEYIARCEAKA